MAAAEMLKRRGPEPTCAAPMTLEDASETYARLVAKREELAGPHLGALQRELDEVVKKLKTADPANAVTGRVAQLLADLDPEARQESAGAVELRARAAELRRQINDTHQALKVLEGRLSHERVLASLTVCKAVQPEYARRVAGMCRALLQAREALLEYQDLVDELERKDIAWTSLHPMHPLFLGRPNDNQGAVAHYLRNAAANGFISSSDIPERLR
jgi:hypothetical protein